MTTVEVHSTAIQAESFESTQRKIFSLSNYTTCNSAIRVIRSTKPCSICHKQNRWWRLCNTFQQSPRGLVRPCCGLTDSSESGQDRPGSRAAQGAQARQARQARTGRPKPAHPQAGWKRRRARSDPQPVRAQPEPRGFRHALPSSGPGLRERSPEGGLGCEPRTRRAYPRPDTASGVGPRPLPGRGGAEQAPVSTDVLEGWQEGERFRPIPDPDLEWQRASPSPRRATAPRTAADRGILSDPSQKRPGSGILSDSEPRTARAAASLARQCSQERGRRVSTAGAGALQWSAEGKDDGRARRTLAYPASAQTPFRDFWERQASCRVSPSQSPG
jgi:hypothetical protein